MNKIIEPKIVNIFLPISFNICLGAQKNRLIEKNFLEFFSILSKNRKCCHDLKKAYGVKG